jgi:DNA-binding MarR family transcriptional regulator
VSTAEAPPPTIPARPGTSDERHRLAVSSFTHAFKDAMGAVRRLRGRESHRPGELSYAQCGLLFGLAEFGELSASELAGVAAVAPATATQMLDLLEASGHVERVRSERDRRLVMVSLTARGREVVEGRRRRYEELWTRQLAAFSLDEIAAATAVVESATAVFEQIETESGDAPEEPST